MARKGKSPGTGLRLLFAGTRGEIEARTRQHQRHSSLVVLYHGQRILVDCGKDWEGKWQLLQPDAIVLTHAHPDHAWGLSAGATCPVYATQDTWNAIGTFPIEQRQLVKARWSMSIGDITFEAFPVEHSIRCPAVGYRIQAGNDVVFYGPDLVYIHERHTALTDVSWYIGDGASVTKPMVRKRGDALIGHAPIQQQLGWCRDEHVPRAVFTHCGSEIVGGDQAELRNRIRQLGVERGVTAELAFDGLEIQA